MVNLEGVAYDPGVDDTILSAFQRSRAAAREGPHLSAPIVSLPLLLIQKAAAVLDWLLSTRTRIQHRFSFPPPNKTRQPSHLYQVHTHEGY